MVVMIVITLVPATVIGLFSGSGALWWKRNEKVTRDFVLDLRFGRLWDFQVEVPSGRLEIWE